MQAFVQPEETYTPFSDSIDERPDPKRKSMRPAASPRPSPADAAAVPSVYVVDDDPSVRRAIARLLLPLQCPVHLFASAEQFLAETRPDARGCLVLDVRLPGMSGLQLLERLPRDHWKLPTIVISAEFTDHGRADALRLGAICVMEKPIDRSRFVATVHAAINERPAD